MFNKKEEILEGIFDYYFVVTDNEKDRLFTKEFNDILHNNYSKISKFDFYNIASKKGAIVDGKRYMARRVIKKIRINPYYETIEVFLKKITPKNVAFNPNSFENQYLALKKKEKEEKGFIGGNIVRACLYDDLENFSN